MSSVGIPENPTLEQLILLNLYPGFKRLTDAEDNSENPNQASTYK